MSQVYNRAADEQGESPLDFALKGRGIVVTGGASGIGRAVVSLLSRCGACVIAVVHECDVGSAPGHLASTFPEFDLSGVTQAWWSGEEPLAERVGRTWEMLKATPCETVAVIGHRGFFKTMLGVELENCEVVEIDWDRRRPWLYEDGRTAPIIWRPDATLYPEQG